MTMTRDQFRQLRDSGLSVEKIAEFEKRRTGGVGGSKQKVYQPPENKNFFDQGGMSFSPEQAVQHPYLNAINKTGQDLATIGGNFANQFALNHPRSALTEHGVDFPQPQTFAAKVAAPVAGVYGAIESPIGKVLGAAGNAVKGSRLAIKAATGAGLGAAGGAAYAPGDRPGNIQGRIEQAKQGAIFGGALPIAGAAALKIPESIGSITTNTGRYFSRIKTRLSPDAIPNINQNPLQRLNQLAKTSKNAAGQDIAATGQEINTIKQTTKESSRQLGYQAKDFRANVNKVVTESRSVLKQNLTKMNADLQKSIAEGSLTFQQKLPEFFRANSQAYGTRLDEISDVLASRNQSITHSQISELINQTLSELDEAKVMDGPARQAVEALKQKYEPKTFKPQIDSQYNAGLGPGNPPVEPLAADPHAPVNFRDLVQDLRNVRQTLSTQAKSGAAGFTQDDLAVQFLNNNLGNYIKDVVPEFANLQKEYTPVIRSMKAAHKVFRPNQGEFNSAGGANFLKRAAMGTARAGEEPLLNSLEQGNSFAKGVGNLSAPVKEIGAKIKGEIAGTAATREKMISGLKEKLAEIEQQKRNLTASSEGSIEQKRVTLENRQLALQKRLDTIELRKEQVRRLLANKQAANEIANSLAPILGKFTPVKKLIVKAFSRKGPGRTPPPASPPSSTAPVTPTPPKPTPKNIEYGRLAPGELQNDLKAARALMADRVGRGKRLKHKHGPKDTPYPYKNY